MSYNEIRESFYAYEQRRIKMDMLVLELQYIVYLLNVKSHEQGGCVLDSFLVAKPTSSLLIDLMGQVYPLIQENKELILKLMNIRIGIDAINDIISFFEANSTKKDEEPYKRIFIEKATIVLEESTKTTNNIGKILAILKTNYGLNTDESKFD